MSNWFPGLAGSRYATRARVQEFLEVTASQAVTEALAQALQELDEDTIAALGLKADQSDLLLLEGRVDDAEAEILLRATIASVTASLALKTDLTVHDILAGRVTANEGDILALQGALGGSASEGDLTAHTGNTSNPHAVTATQVGLGSVDNTSDLDKPISTATQTALDLKQDEGDPVLGTVQALTGDGAASLTDLVTTLTTDAATQAVTLADGAAGQVKVIALAAQLDPADVATVTPTTATGFTSFDLTAPGQSVTLIWAGGWIITANNGATIT